MKFCFPDKLVSKMTKWTFCNHVYLYINLNASQNVDKPKRQQKKMLDLSQQLNFHSINLNQYIDMILQS